MDHRQQPTDRDAIDDAGWFDLHRARRYHIRGTWAVRRVAGVYLRTAVNTTTTNDDSEAIAEATWWAAAWPGLDPTTRLDLMRKARKRGR